MGLELIPINLCASDFVRESQVEACTRLPPGLSTIPSCFLPPPVHVYTSSLPPALSLSLLHPSRKSSLTFPFPQAKLMPHTGLRTSFLQGQGSGHRTTSRLRPLGVSHQRRREQLFPCPRTSQWHVSPGNVSAQGNSPGCPHRSPDVQILQGPWPTSMALSLCEKPDKQTRLGRGSYTDRGTACICPVSVRSRSAHGHTLTCTLTRPHSWHMCPCSHSYVHAHAGTLIHSRVALGLSLSTSLAQNGLCLAASKSYQFPLRFPLFAPT